MPETGCLFKRIARLTGCILLWTGKEYEPPKQTPSVVDKIQECL